MNLRNQKINQSLFRLKAQISEGFLAKQFALSQPPLRSELFTADQMEQHGKSLASTHILGNNRTQDQHLLGRLAENELFLVEVHSLLTEAVKATHQITPAGEWLLDNFYLIEEQIRTGKRHLPKGYIKELPCLLKGASKGLPRVYDIALETISHGDGRVDPENLSRFVTAYQTVTALKLGELWAIPTMLRLALIENLRRVAVRIAAGKIDRDLAAFWADQMIDMAEKDPKSLVLIIADMARSDPNMTTAFVSEFTRRLQGLSHILISPLTWIEQRLSESGLTIERLIQTGNQEQAADQVSISNSIGSLRFLESTDWRTFVESMSVVESNLKKDPLGVYSKMDFTTRDHYRHVIEEIAKNSRLTEEEVAKHAVGMSKKSVEERKTHIGYYLIDKGRKELESKAKVRFSFLSAIQNISSRFPLFIYVTAILIITIISTMALQSNINNLDKRIYWFITILLLLCTSQLAVTIVNWLSSIMVKPQPLPKMDFSEGIPGEYRTLVVVPSLLMNEQNIKDLTESLEVRFLANQDDNLRFALLTDFKDAKTETLPEDENLLLLVSSKIEDLNEKYKASGKESFFLFHRPRKWNYKEQIWMGYERKRGKLEEINCYLRSGNKDNFSLIIGNTEALENIKYVITLDTDTQLPRDSARQLSATIAHPLNRAYYNERKKRVTEGYSILQPRVAVSLPGTNRSHYAKLYGSQPGIDPYTRTVSDIYQDAFSEGSFIGKGIYEIDLFSKSLKGCFPENLILSHDLLEGSYARAALLTDVQLFEEYPPTYNTDVNRRRRWIRGDWQLWGWLFPVAPGPKGWQKNPISMLSRWKLFDNLRRSLIPTALVLTLLSGWILLSQPLFWTLIVLGILTVPSIIIYIADLIKKPVDMRLSQHLTTANDSASTNFKQAAFTLITLPYEAFFSMDAILRTLWRMFFSHKKLLQWDQVRSVPVTLFSTYKKMWISSFVVLATAFYFWFFNLTLPAAAIPILFLWAASPIAAWWISLPVLMRKPKLSAIENTFLRVLSRRTWAFFETFVTKDDNYLPPDNYQEVPVGIVAHRTSPTNMGMALLSNLSAYDFGYISIGAFIKRTSRTFQTMELLERYHGHFLNWYDTQTLLPLKPRYISSVDSGNLAANLLTLSQGILDLPNQKIISNEIYKGMNDALIILTEAAEGRYSELLDKMKTIIQTAIDNPPDTITETWVVLNQLASLSAEVEGKLSKVRDEQTVMWAHYFAAQCRDFLDELIYLAPWVTVQDNEARKDKFPLFSEMPTLNELAEAVNRYQSDNKPHPLIIKAGKRLKDRAAALLYLAQQSTLLAEMEFGFLYDKTRHLLSIGYNVDEKRRDSSFYDLLASESRLSNFVGIAKGQLPQESWFALGRLLTTLSGEPILLSWSGSMFEYLMPLLIMPTYENTLLDQTYKAAVKRQIEYGRKRNVPWGISESCYNTVDGNQNYQYRAFGVPGLGLKRGLAEDLVITPYASVLALMVKPEEACSNLQDLNALGFLGDYGFYEAVDYTPSRLIRDQEGAVIKTFMAHHQGMSLLSLAYLLLDRPMQKRFQSDPLFEATMLLLQERIPRTTLFYTHPSGLSDTLITSGSAEIPIRKISNPDIAVPETQLLSNGRYHVMVSSAGGGYSKWRDINLTRWHEDTTSDNWGTFCYIRDSETGEFWSAAYQPALKRTKYYEAIFSEGRAEFRRQDQNFEVHTEIVVSPEDDIELRRVHLTNHSRNRKTIELTSYAEVVLATAASDALHPAFSNLFVQTEILEDSKAILCTRRPRSPEEKTLWMFHMMVVRTEAKGELSFETDRMQFIGRGNSINTPLAMRTSLKLSNSQGSVLDPIVAIRDKITFEAEQTIVIDMIFGIGETRGQAIGLIEKYHDRRLANRVFELSWTHSQVELRQINASESDAQLYGRLANSVIYTNSNLRADASIIIKNRRGQSGLWGYTISGDLPIILLQIENLENIEIVRQVVQAHSYWRLKGLIVDLVIWNEDRAGYRQELQEQIMRLIAAGVDSNNFDRPGGIFIRQADQISNEDRILIQTVARVILSDRQGTLQEQVNNREIGKMNVRRFKPSKTYHPPRHEAPVLPRTDLAFFNGYGGFTQDGREYIITTSVNHVTPAPWVNVIANADFGTVVSENGPNYTWSENAHEYRLTPWNNDPVTDSGGEAFYIRDEETGHFWSPAPIPSRSAGPYVSRHGFGYSVFEHTEAGIQTELWIYVAVDAPVKFSLLKVKNISGRARRLSATSYAELVLGDLKEKTSMHVVTEIDSSSRAILARNSYSPDFPSCVTFFHSDDSSYISCDRTEFIGRNGTLKKPAAMSRMHLSGNTGTALDPCAAIQVPFELQDGQEREVIFKLGTGRDFDEAIKLIQQFRGSFAARKSLEDVWQFWKYTLGAVQIETQDISLNILTNGWLLYQTLSCRFWARSGYYQSGGAFGFRDQLQDSMALIYTKPDLVRKHLLLCASRQFCEGDVQHWWHPPSGKGVRTHCSDDYLWLPFVTCHYVLNTGDYGVLDEQARYLEGRAVNAEDDSYYDLPITSGEAGDLYQHCVRAITRGLNYGQHNLPLIGTGDWNDGMNMVGNKGKGESIWLAFFLYKVLMQFSRIARIKEDFEFVDRCLNEAYTLRQNIEQNGWDGEWYLRAFFDDGSPIGSKSNPECKIDSIVQSWSVLSGAGDEKRTHLAMDALNKHLIRRDHGLVQLLHPPFDKSNMNPGYIKGYVPGVRENGGQYTHAAIWAAMAFAALGDSKHAWEVLTIINPIYHGQSGEDIARYKVEPYVVAADVYALSPHIGRGGWTWYTGSAGWMYRLILESLLGLRLETDKLYIEPCIPENWETYKMSYRYRETNYNIFFFQERGSNNKLEITADGIRSNDQFITLIDDHQEHHIEVRITAGYKFIKN